MRFDTIVIGGGLSGLVSAVRTASAGKKTAIVSAGQSALHFWSGSFELLGNLDGKEIVADPLSYVDSLSDGHPYRRIGRERLSRLMGEVPALMSKAGIKVNGSLERNHYRMTPLGFVKPAWLTLDDYVMFKDPGNMPWSKVAVVNIEGYLDFYPRFLSYGLRKHGVDSVTATVDIPQFATFRKSTTEMRATNIARFLTDDAVLELASRIDDVSKGCDAVIMPAVIGMFSDRPVTLLRENVSVPVYFVATTPASVPGVRCQLSLIDLFTRLGGVFLPGDTVTKGEISNHRIRRIYTANFGDMPLEADDYILSTGSFFGHGLIATIDRIYEPVFGLDLNVKGGRTDWYDTDFYASQPYMGYGVVTDSDFHPSLKGETVDNLYATGALLSGFNALKEGSGAGITLATAMHAADRIVRGAEV